MTFSIFAKQTIKKVLPKPLLRLGYMRQAERLKRIVSGKSTPAEILDALSQFNHFQPQQIRSEILRLLELVKKHEPVTICEIGAATGGTLFLFSQVAKSDATIVSVDIAYDERIAAMPLFGKSGQKILAQKLDSHDPKSVTKVKTLLQDKKLDLLYIDGDHTYEGVKSDFELFSPLVRAGGLIVFHDIMPDYRTRYGHNYGPWVGEVPRYWEELKEQYASFEEIIENPEQDGFGLGVIYWK